MKIRIAVPLKFITIEQTQDVGSFTRILATSGVTNSIFLKIVDTGVE
jgi:hypothetical protein